MYNIFLQSIKLITKEKLWQRKKCLGMSDVSKVCLVGGWSFLYPLDPEVGGSGPASQKLPGSIDILAGAPDRLHFLAFTQKEKFKCEKQD